MPTNEVHFDSRIDTRDLPPDVEALVDRIWERYSLDGKTLPADMRERACADFESGLTALGYRKAM